MLSSVLRSDRAIQVNIEIMRAFVRLRELLATHVELARRLDDLERQFREHDEQFVLVFDAIRKLMEPPQTPPPEVGYHTCRPCREDEVGEIWVRGASVAQGYFRQPEATQLAFHGFLVDTRDGPFLRTGDLGFVRRGQLFVTGRLKDLIIIRGRNYYPEDIEVTFDRADPSFRAGHGVAFSVKLTIYHAGWSGRSCSRKRCTVMGT